MSTNKKNSGASVRDKGEKPLKKNERGFDKEERKKMLQATFTGADVYKEAKATIEKPKDLEAIKICNVCEKVSRRNPLCTCRSYIQRRNDLTVEEFEEACAEYFVGTGWVRVVVTNKYGDEIEQDKFKPATVKGLGVHLGMSAKELRTLCKDSAFRAVYERAKQVCEWHMEQGGVEGVLNSPMTMFTLKNNYEWKDRQEIDTTLTLDQRIKAMENERVVVDWTEEVKEADVGGGGARLIDVGAIMENAGGGASIPEAKKQDVENVVQSHSEDNGIEQVEAENLGL